jgi:hypothetical protein
VWWSWIFSQKAAPIESIGRALKSVKPIAAKPRKSQAPKWITLVTKKCFCLATGLTGVHLANINFLGFRMFMGLTDINTKNLF